MLSLWLDEVALCVCVCVCACVCSMGAPYLALFLRRHVTPAWQARHIAGHIAISGGPTSCGSTLHCCCQGD